MFGIVHKYSHKKVFLPDGHHRLMPIIWELFYTATNESIAVIQDQLQQHRMKCHKNLETHELYNKMDKFDIDIMLI